jgi:hypothetical protein
VSNPVNIIENPSLIATTEIIESVKITSENKFIFAG